MWKKDDRLDEVPTEQQSRPQPRPAPTAPSATTGNSYASGSSEAATIGRSITVRGDITGDEDLRIQGRVEGSVSLPQHSISVGADGEVIASILGRLVTVEGRVEGNIDGGEQVILRNSAMVKGDITAPRVVLEDGARFRGLVDMGAGEGAADDKTLWTGVGARADAQKSANGSSASTSDGASSARMSEKPAPESAREASSTDGARNSASDSSIPSPTGSSSKGKKPNDAEAQITL